jgi:hypothetical protein
MSDIPIRIRKLVKNRDQGVCRRCETPGNNIHHRIGRGMGGTSRDDVNNLAALVTLCGSGTTGCHGYITSHPTEAYETGWSIRRSNPDPAADIPLMDLLGRQMFLTEDGGCIYSIGVAT